MKIDKILESNNLVKDLKDDLLLKIGSDVVSGYENDLDTRKDWEKDLKSWTELALQITQEKTFPWPNAANIKYPLLATAAMQFAARAYPTLIPSNNQVVKCRVIGYDQDGQKTQRAERISKHMSYQLLDEMDDWEEDMDKLLITLPIAGTCFKKTFWDAGKQRNVSKLILPKALVVNYWCRRLEDAERISELIYLSRRTIKERQNQGIYADIDLGDPSTETEDERTSVNGAFQKVGDDPTTTPYTIIEQHCYLDLDEDGYSEPYVVTVDLHSKKVLRIVPRFTKDSVILSDKNSIVSIEPINFYTKYGFIPNPDGGFYDIGFGRLLGPLNNSANTIINQLVDAGSLSNLQAGFIGKGLRIKMGQERFQPGEWKAVNAIGDDLKKQIFPLPVREPSEVLFKLLDLLLKSGKELASVAEIFVGKMPGQNTPATTTMATIEQGMKVFTAVYKRVYRSLTSEFRKLYKLNRQYLNPEEYVAALDTEIQQSDYEGSEEDIIPGADPNAISNQEKQQKVQAIMQILQLGTIDPMWATAKYMEAHEITDWQQGMRQQQPQPDPKMEAIKAKAQVDQQKAHVDMQVAEHKMQLERATKEQEMQMKAAQLQQELEAKKMQAVLDAQLAQAESHQKLQMSAQEHSQSLVQQHQQNKLQMATQQANHKMQMQHQQAANKQKLTSQEKKANAPSKSK